MCPTCLICTKWCGNCVTHALYAHMQWLDCANLFHLVANLLNSASSSRLRLKEQVALITAADGFLSDSLLVTISLCTHKTTKDQHNS